MALLLLLCSGCTVDVENFQECSPVPNFESETPPDFGAVCDQFLFAKQEILTHAEWIARQKLWLIGGAGVSCVPSTAIANLKKEIEKLCSVAKCNYVQLKLITDGLARFQANAALALP